MAWPVHFQHIFKKVCFLAPLAAIKAITGRIYMYFALAIQTVDQFLD